MTQQPSPQSYVIWHKSQLCTNCGVLSEHSELYLRTDMVPHWDRGRRVTNLHSLDAAPQFQLPIERREAQMTKIPFCFACKEPSRAISGLPRPAAQQPELLGSKFEDPEQPPKMAKPSTRKTLDDLLDLI